MRSNYYRSAFRSLRRSPFYTALNIAGLALGIAFTLLIGVFCWSELIISGHRVARNRTAANCVHKSS